jgi:hypothetical protein
MPKTNKRDVRIQRADLRRRSNQPAPPLDDIQQRLLQELTPATFAQARGAHTHLKLRDRTLNLPTMCAILLSLVWRQIPSLSEVVRVLSKEGLLWAEAVKVSVEALSKRFEKMPAALFATVFEQLLTASAEKRHHKRQQIACGAIDEAAPEHRLQQLEKIYTAVLIADASTLEQVRKTTTELRQQATAVLGGKMLVIVEALTHLPMAAFFEENAKSNEKLFNDRILESVPAGGMIVLDAGFFSFGFFDAFTDGGKFFLTRMKANVSYRSISVLSEGRYYRDEIIEVGLHRTAPCKHQLRMVSVLWGTTWYRYLTNELDPKRLSAKDLVTLYRGRWRIEDAFLLTKRLLGLSYLWVGSSNGIQLQIYATWIFYAILIELCHEVALALEQPLERISVEMVFRSLYHYSRELMRNPETDVIEFLAENAKLFAVVKTERKRHRQRDEQLAEIWSEP